MQKGPPESDPFNQPISLSEMVGIRTCAPLASLRIEAVTRSVVRKRLRDILQEGKGVISDRASHAMRDIRAAIDIPDITVHDLRRSGATRLAKARVSPFILSKLRNHANELGGGSSITMAAYVQATGGARP